MGVLAASLYDKRPKCFENPHPLKSNVYCSISYDWGAILWRGQDDPGRSASVRAESALVSDWTTGPSRIVPGHHKYVLCYFESHWTVKDRGGTLAEGSCESCYFIVDDPAGEGHETYRV